MTRRRRISYKSSYTKHMWLLKQGLGKGKLRFDQIRTHELDDKGKYYARCACCGRRNLPFTYGLAGFFGYYSPGWLCRACASEVGIVW